MTWFSNTQYRLRIGPVIFRKRLEAWKIWDGQYHSHAIVSDSDHSKQIGTLHSVTILGMNLQWSSKN